MSRKNYRHAETDRAAPARSPSRRSSPAAGERRSPSRLLEPGEIAGARPAPLPASVQPQLATLAASAPDGERWLHEIKFDGYRLICRLENGEARFFTRRGNDWTSHFARLLPQVRALPARAAILDGEVVSMNEDGRTDFQNLQNAIRGEAEAPLFYVLFDLLHLDGHDLGAVPLIERKRLLAALLEGAAARHPLILYSDHVEGHGAAFFAEACKYGHEGIVSKLRNAPYRPGRSRSWLKIKCSLRQEFVIGGYSEPSGSRVGLGALLLGVHDGNELRYAGRVGTGFGDDSLRDLRQRLAKLEVESAPFVQPPERRETRGVHWVKPVLVAEVRFSGWTRDGRLRQPSFAGLREDKPAREVVREKAAPPPRPARAGRGNPRPAKPGPGRTAAKKGVAVAGVPLTNPDRVLYPADGITKQELALYYEAVADWILPHLEDRPLTVVRCPEGHEKGCFYQKHASAGQPGAIRLVPIQEDGASKAEDYLMVDSLQGLVSLVQMGVLEMHTWGSRTRRLEFPDQAVFDLDPDPAVPWERVVEAARLLRERLEGLGLESFLKTTGGKGLHVVVPLAARQGWEEVKEFTRLVALRLSAEFPDRYVATMSKARRRGKIFIDYLRNGRGATAVAAYSSRARRGAPVSTPVRWEELDHRLRPDAYTVRNLPQRLQRLRRDPWEGFGRRRQSITKTAWRDLGKR